MYAQKVAAADGDGSFVIDLALVKEDRPTVAGVLLHGLAASTARRPDAEAPTQIGCQHFLRTVEHRTQESRGTISCDATQPIIRVRLADADHGVGISWFAVHHNPAYMVCMQMCDKHQIHLFRTVAGCAQ